AFRFGVRAHRAHEGEVLHLAGIAQRLGEGFVQVDIHRAVLLERELRGAGADAQYAEAFEITVEVLRRREGGGVEQGGIHFGDEDLAQFLLPWWQSTAQRPARNREDAGERFVAEQLFQQRAADRAGGAEDDGGEPAHIRSSSGVALMRWIE